MTVRPPPNTPGIADWWYTQIKEASLTWCFFYFVRNMKKGIRAREGIGRISCFGPFVRCDRNRISADRLCGSRKSCFLRMFTPFSRPRFTQIDFGLIVWTIWRVIVQTNWVFRDCLHHIASYGVNIWRLWDLFTLWSPKRCKQLSNIRLVWTAPRKMVHTN